MLLLLCVSVVSHTRSFVIVTKKIGNRIQERHLVFGSCVCVEVMVFCVPHGSWSPAIRCLAASRGVSLQLKGGSAGCLLFARLAQMDFCHFFSL